MPTPPTTDSPSPFTHLNPNPRSPCTHPNPDPPPLCTHPKPPPPPPCAHSKPQQPSPRIHPPSPCAHSKPPPSPSCTHSKPQPSPPCTHSKPPPPFPFTHPSPNSPPSPTHQNSTIGPYPSSGSTPTHPPPTNSPLRVAPSGPLTLLAALFAFAIPLASASPAVADRPTWRWPLDGHPRVLRHFTPPPEPWLSGHRGIDLAAAPTTPVVAAGPGIVRFAGPLAGRGVVTVEHANGLRTTYLPVNASVRRNQHVSPGTRLGFIERPTGHCQESCLHWGLLRGAHYLDPLLLLGQAHIRLLPYWHLNSPNALNTPDGTNGPGGSGGPGDSGDPGGSGDPGDPDGPDGPSSPGGPSDPGGPGGPGGPGDPGDPDSPGGPGDPGDPDSPGGPDEPGDPDSPGGPDEPGATDGTSGPNTLDRNTLGGPNALNDLDGPNTLKTPDGPYALDGPSDLNAVTLSTHPSLPSTAHLQKAPISAAPSATASSTALPSTSAIRSDPIPAPAPTPLGQAPEHAVLKPALRFVAGFVSTVAISAISVGTLFGALLLFTLIRRNRCTRTQQHGAARGQHRKQQRKRRYRRRAVGKKRAK